MGNSSRLFWVLVGGDERKKLYEMITREEYDDAEARVNAAVAPLDARGWIAPDADLIKDEIRNAAAMLRHACRRGRWLLDRESDSPVRDGAGIARHRRRTQTPLARPKPPRGLVRQRLTARTDAAELRGRLTRQRIDMCNLIGA